MQKKNENEKPKLKTPQILRGMKDILPAEQKYWNFVKTKIDDTANDYGFERIDTPILEETSLFLRSVGKETDIVEKEMYTFIDKSGDNVTMRPEGTAPVVRAYIEHGMITQPQPVKLYYFGPFFRHDRPQAGRLRQLHQFGFEVLGDSHPVIDAQIIKIASNIYKEMGVDITVQINSVGCVKCRDDYKKVLIDYYKNKKNIICANCKVRLMKNPLRLLDCKENDCQPLIQNAPQMVDHLCEECRDHFVKVLEILDAMEVVYNLNHRIVRGLDYYTRTTFEIWSNEGEGQRGLELGGGGRYDSLVESLGGRPTPAIGFASGIERFIMAIKENNIVISEPKKPQVFIAQLGDQARKKSLQLFEELRREKVKARENFSKDGMKSQMEQAVRLGVKFVLILGQKEIMDDTIIIRDMEGGIQEIVAYDRIITEIKKRLEKSGVNSQVFFNNQPLIK